MLIGVIAEELLNPLSVEPGRFIDGPFGGAFGLPDIFLQARIFQIGFVSPGLVDETNALFGAENLYATYVTNGYLGIFPDTFIDSEIFYDFAHSSVPVLTPPWWIDTDFILSPKLDIRAISFGRYVDPDIFYSPAFKSSVFPGLAVDNDIIRTSVIRRDGDDIVLLLELFNDSDDILAESLSRAVLPGLVTVSDIIYTAAQGAFLAPAAFSSSDTFYAALIFNQLLPSLVPADDVFIGPELRTPGRMGLFVDDDIFFVPSAQFAPLLPPLVADTDVFFSPAAAEAVIVPLDPIVDFDDTFYVPNVIIFQALTPHLWPEVDIFFSVPSVALGQPLFPALFNEGDVFFAPITTLVPVLFPALFADAEVFFAPTVKFDQFLVQQFTAVDSDNFYSPSIAALSTFSGMIAIDGPIMPSTPQPTVIYLEG